MQIRAPGALREAPCLRRPSILTWGLCSSSIASRAGAVAPLSRVCGQLTTFGQRAWRWCCCFSP
eukprot:7756719-Alexandrium_andersonii.AAC.1